MTLIKKIDVEKYFAAKRAMRRTGAQLVARPDASGILETKMTGTKTNARDFVEDFSAQHSTNGSASSSK